MCGCKSAAPRGRSGVDIEPESCSSLLLSHRGRYASVHCSAHDLRSTSVRGALSEMIVLRTLSTKPAVWKSE